MPKAALSVDWALTKVDRNERATVVAKNNIMGVDSCEGSRWRSALKEQKTRKWASLWHGRVRSRH
jgi:hypothetical protein